MFHYKGNRNKQNAINILLCIVKENDDVNFANFHYNMIRRS